MTNNPATFLMKLTLLTLVATVPLVGCGGGQGGSSVGTSPSESTDGSAPLFLTGFDGIGGDSAASEGGSGKDGADVEPGSDAAADGNEGDDSPEGELRSRAEVDGAVGGTVTAGRFSVYFPPGAFPGTESIVVEEKAGEVVECRLEPHGLSFAVPVALTVDLEYTTGDDGRTEIFWYDESSRAWVNMAGDYSATGHSVTTELDHFSRYRPGRAGW